MKSVDWWKRRRSESMASTDAENRYILGESDREIARLQYQAQFFQRETREALLLAGLAPGMQVLDIGCGAGDVSLIAAEIVGTQGHVCGLDQSPSALESATRRVAANGIGNTHFELGDIRFYSPHRTVDALIGRFILLHLREPTVILRQILQNILPGGILAFMELDISSAAVAPRGQLFQRCLSWIVDVYHRGGYEPDMGSRLYGAFRAAGLDPTLTCACRVEGAQKTTGYDFIAQSIQSLMPTMISLGVVSEEEIGIGDLAERLRAEGCATDQCVVFPRFVCAWAKAPIRELHAT
jgi:ubiquinone/menaquinone biosynthesis C-methylase UbiE